VQFRELSGDLDGVGVFGAERLAVLLVRLGQLLAGAVDVAAVALQQRQPDADEGAGPALLVADAVADLAVEALGRLEVAEFVHDGGQHGQGADAGRVARPEGGLGLGQVLGEHLAGAVALAQLTHHLGEHAPGGADLDPVGAGSGLREVDDVPEQLPRLRQCTGAPQAIGFGDAAADVDHRALAAPDRGTGSGPRRGCQSCECSRCGSLPSTPSD
jgi:hypothetical protein